MLEQVVAIPQIGDKAPEFIAITKVEKVMRFVAGLVFIPTGLYYINIYFKLI